ncbi:MAG: hypothetical protein AAGA77_08965, partial [Bacteroidota bacterium]
CDHTQRAKRELSNVSVRSKDGKVLFYTHSERLYLDVPMNNGRLTPIVIGAQLKDKPRKDGYELVLIEEDASGKPLGGFALNILPKK